MESPHSYVRSLFKKNQMERIPHFYAKEFFKRQGFPIRGIKYGEGLASTKTLIWFEKRWSVAHNCIVFFAEIYPDQRTGNFNIKIIPQIELHDGTFKPAYQAEDTNIALHFPVKYTEVKIDQAEHWEKICVAILDIIFDRYLPRAMAVKMKITYKV